jgi:hypothetical protein
MIGFNFVIDIINNDLYLRLFIIRVQNDYLYFITTVYI